jgi:Family of unknown function (DUF6884)
MRVGLVGCVKTKKVTAAPARDLYTSALFLGRRRFVERKCDRWFVLSAKHGLVDPDKVLEPYDETLKDAGEERRRLWSHAVLRSLERELGDLKGMSFEAHAGSAYMDHGLAEGLEARGASVERPTEGLSLGRQLAFYKQSSQA